MSMHIVFVDDSKSALDTIETLLKQQIKSGAISLRTFSKAVDFLDEIKTDSLESSFLFWCVDMPLLSGYDLLHKLWEIEQYQYIPIASLVPKSLNESKHKKNTHELCELNLKLNASSSLLSTIYETVDDSLPQAINNDKSEYENLDAEHALREIQKMFITVEKLKKKLMVVETNKMFNFVHNEFNDTLTTLTKLMQDVIEDKKNYDEIAEYISLIFANVLILNSYLSKKISKTLSMFNIREMIETIIDANRLIYKEKQMEVTMELILPHIVYNDHDKCFLILRNIIENAFESSAEMGKCVINGYVEDANIIFLIKNFKAQKKEERCDPEAFYYEWTDFCRIHHRLGTAKYLSDYLGGAAVHYVEDDYIVFKMSLPIASVTLLDSCRCQS